MEGFKESDRWKSLELSATLTLSSIGDSSEALVHIFFSLYRPSITFNYN
jgi:hypothetical protein